MLRWGKIGLGFLLVIMGIVGGFLPIVQGWMFMLPGLAILATEFVWARKIDDWVKAKFRLAIAKFKQSRAEHKRDHTTRS